MRIISQIQPLLFCFSNTDKLLDGIHYLRDKSVPCRISQFRGNYYATLSCSLLERKKIRTELSEFGSFVGIGVVLDAFIAEHGKRICETLLISKKL